MLIVVFIIVAYIMLHRPTDLSRRLHSRQGVKPALAVPSQPYSTESWQQQQQESDDVSLYFVVKVQSAGNFTDRVATFNAFLSSLREEELKRQGTGAWKRPTSSRLKVVSGAIDNYLELLSNYSSIRTVALPWLTSSGSLRAWSSLVDTSNLLIQTYYAWTADDKLCSWIETTAKTNNYYAAMYNQSCNRNINDTVQPSSLQPLYLNRIPTDRNSYWPNGGGSLYPDKPPYVFYMHIHRDAVVTELGDVITDGLKLVLDTCSNDVKPSLPSRLDSIPIYNEVFVVSQFWGAAIFHRMVEIVPRLALFVDFLTANPEIRILATEANGRLAELVKIIGLNASRLVAGVARAKIVYQPRSTRCGFANVQESQTLSQIYRDYIKRTFPPHPRNRLVLIRRSGSRRFSEQLGIEAALKRAAVDYNLTYTLFIDNPTPSLNDTMVMFHSAVIIVAPHGAGETNMIFSQPGTYIVEGVCNPPHVNLCLQRLAYVLGHHWHGVMSRGGCSNFVSVSVHEIDTLTRKFLHLWKVSQT